MYGKCMEAIHETIENVCGIIWPYPPKLMKTHTFDPAMLLLRIYPTDRLTHMERHVCTKVFIVALIMRPKVWK